MRQINKWLTGSLLRDFFLSVLLAGWLYQILSPLEKVGQIPDMTGFYLFVGGLLLIDLVVPWKWIKWILKLVAVLAMLRHYYYWTADLQSWQWIKHAATELGSGVWLALQKRYAEVSEMVRTFSFLLFLWLTASVYRNSLENRVWLFILLLIGEVVLGVIDTFFSVDASGYVVRYFLFGFLLLALSQLPELEKWARIPERLRGWSGGWLIWTLVITLTAVGTGIASPKYPPAWPDPLSFLQGKAAREGTGVKRIGYGNQDDRLGGSFVMDETPVFSVTTNQRGYYRGESKTIYTGKGWLSSGRNIPESEGRPLAAWYQDQKLREVYGLSTDVKTKEVTQEFQISSPFAVLLAQYQLTNIVGSSRPSSLTNYFNPAEWKTQASLRPGDSYTVISQVPYYDPDKIREREQLAKGNSPWASYVNSDYLQLPDPLPERVEQLARDITAGKTSAFDKAKAIEEYLRTNNRYQIDNIPYPAEGQDFVDQFLFETKVGYCDHFSTSMVVLARSVGLPARWAKGFTEGEMDLSGELPNKEMTKYVVRNKNAHSWPEIYIPGSGWIPFEPTATFTQPVLQEVTALPLTNQPESTPKEKPNTPKEADSSADVSYTFDWSLLGKIAGFMLLISLALAVVFWRKLMVAYYLRRPVTDGINAASSVVAAIDRLLMALQRFGFKREPDVTVREFGAEITNKGIRGNEWVLLSRIFERVRYGNKPLQNNEINEFKSLWERILRKIGRTKKH